MAAQTRVRLLLAGAASLVLAGVMLYLPVRATARPALQPPERAAERAEHDLPSLGLVWGKVRGWERVGDGWTVLWQPSHGMWLISAWVPDGPGTILWRVEAASWLPGVRLPRRAAEALLGRGEPVAQARERLGRRDWLVGESRLLGALPAGGDLPPRDPSRRPLIEAVLAGLLLAGAVSRHLVPGVPSRGWRRAVSLAVLVLALTVPQLSALSPGSFQAGVRPWVAELSFGTAAVLLFGALVFAGQRFPAPSGTVPAGWLVVALAAGVLAGRIEPSSWLAGTADLSLRLPVWVCLTVLAGWLAAFAADGLREMVRSVFVRSVGLSILAAAGVLFGGPWLGVTLGVVAAAAVERGWGTWVAVGVVWGWVFGSVWALARWEAGMRDALAFLVLGCSVVAVAYLVRARPTAASEAAQP
jgi:hypothetical protein